MPEKRWFSLKRWHSAELLVLGAVPAAACLQWLWTTSTWQGFHVFVRARSLISAYAGAADSFWELLVIWQSLGFQHLSFSWRCPLFCSHAAWGLRTQFSYYIDYSEHNWGESNCQHCVSGAKSYFSIKCSGKNFLGSSACGHLTSLFGHKCPLFLWENSSYVLWAPTLPRPGKMKSSVDSDSVMSAN